MMKIDWVDKQSFIRRVGESQTGQYRIRTRGQRFKGEHGNRFFHSKWVVCRKKQRGGCSDLYNHSVIGQVHG